MPLPRTVLIDTNIFEQYGYSFASQPVEKFLAIAQVKDLTLLLPDAIEREVLRHIKDKSAAARSALKKARHDAPFLQKWANWPSTDQMKNVKDDIAAAYIAGWEEFLKKFKVKKSLIDPWAQPKPAPLGSH
jgi:predicted nucleic acid-binding protein